MIRIRKIIAPHIKIRMYKNNYMKKKKKLKIINKKLMKNSKISIQYKNLKKLTKIQQILKLNYHRKKLNKKKKD